MKLLNVLRDVDIFYELSTEHLEKLAAICRGENYSKGDVIVRENNPSNELFVITKGTVEIVIDPSLLGDQGGNTEPATIATLWPGQTFGEVGLVDRGLRSASAHAASDDTQLQAIRREDLTKLCEEDTYMGYVLMRNVASDLAFKIRNADLMLREQLLWASRPQEPQS